MNERSVRVGSFEEKDSIQAVGSGVDHGAISWQPMSFKQEMYSNFRVEYAFNDGVFVVHFFVHPQAIRQWPESSLEHWWQNDFARTMSDVAQQHFQATLPRIIAKYTMETASWWFRAQGYGYLLDPEGFLLAFFALLDETLPTVDGRPPAREVARV